LFPSISTVQVWLYRRVRLSRPFLRPLFRRTLLVADLPVNGKTMRVPIQGMVGIILLGEDYTENWKTKLLERLVGAFPDFTFVDVGTNVGQTLMQLRSVSDRVTYVGFEANPRAAVYLSALVEENKFPRTTIITAALAGETGAAKLLLQGPAEYTDQSASMIAELRPDRGDTTTTVITAPFDMVFSSLGLKPPRVIKIDVEGAELDVLRGMTQTLERDRPLILCEVLLSDPKAGREFMDRRNAELIRLLDRHGYVVCHLSKTRSHIRGVTRLREFPSGFWTPQRSEECDYLFLPAEEADPILARLALPDLGN